MEDLQKKHRQELKDLQARILQKKKSATKKTRRGVNDECATLERQLKERQYLQISQAENESVQAVISSATDAEQAETDTYKEAVLSQDHSSQPGECPPTVPLAEQPKKLNRQKARLARRAAEQEAHMNQAAKEAESLPNLREQERYAMQTRFVVLNLQEKEIRSDGHCLYAAVADQLISHAIDLRIRDGNDSKEYHSNVIPDYKIIRQVAASYIASNPDDYLPFLEQPLEEYVKIIRETGEWGGHLELAALSKAYGVLINVLQSDGRVEKIGDGIDNPDKHLWLAYYRHVYALGEHYNSLHPVG